LCQLTRDGEVYHDYCLNYPKAVCYLEQLRKNEDFGEFEKVSVNFEASLDLPYLRFSAIGARKERKDPLGAVGGGFYS